MYKEPVFYFFRFDLDGDLIDCSLPFPGLYNKSFVRRDDDGNIIGVVTARCTNEAVDKALLKRREYIEQKKRFNNE